MKKWIKKIAFCVLLFPATLLFEKIYEEVTYRFSLSNIRYEETAFKPKEFLRPFVDDVKTKEIQTILSQKYHYLGKGNQSYAFESEDSKYVLKFFKFGHLKPFRLPIPFLKEYFATKTKSQEKRFLKVFDGYQIAYSEDPENSALLFIHLNQTNDLKKTVLVTDQLGIEHTIDLDKIVFVLQEKVIPTKQILTDLFEQKDIEGVKRRISQLFDLYLAQYKKGLYDRDHNLIYNTGFKDEKAIRLDVGKFRKEDSFKDIANYKKDLEKIAFERILKWVKTYYPSYENEIASSLNKKLDELFNKNENNE